MAELTVVEMTKNAETPRDSGDYLDYAIDDDCPPANGILSQGDLPGDSTMTPNSRQKG